MSTAKLCGYDVNGWHDCGARNWIAKPGEEEEIGPEHVGHSGALSSVVHAGEGSDACWIGGSPAALAPHGLGGGWGRVGALERRHSVRALLEGQVENQEALAAAFTGIARGARFNVAAIEEGLEETAQERLLHALTGARFSNPLLVWRSVLAVLSRFATWKPDRETLLGIVSQAADGFSVQTLRIRPAGRGSGVWAPERSRAATTVQSAFGYRSLVDLALQLVLGEEGLTARTAHRARARTVGRLALGHDVGSEVLRRENGDWEILSPPTKIDLPDELLAQEGFAQLAECDEVLFESLASGDVHDNARRICETAAQRRFTCLPSTSVAQGALEAARRVSVGEPVYFDFLPRISTIVVSGGEVANYDLIDASETLEAGRLYRSPRPAELAIPPGQERLSIYLRKDAEPHPRKAEVEVGKASAAPVPVSLWVEQKPAAGRARILLEAAEIGRRFMVDWEAANVVEEDWETLIDSLATPPPSIPSRLVLACGMYAWESGSRGPGLTELLEQNVRRRRPDWDGLAMRLASRPYQRYCISSDGELPPEVTTDVIAELDELTDRALDETRARIKGGRQTSNDALRFLTWQFRRCPGEVSSMLLDCISERGLEMFSHPFITHPSHAVLVYQGAARTIRDPGDERRLLKSILHLPLRSWNWRVETACLAILLSRSETAPLQLERSEVETMARRVLLEFKDNLGSDYTKFYYAPFLLAGLLRFRLKEPRALVVGAEPVADRLAAAVDATLQDFDRKRPRSERFDNAAQKYRPILSDLRDELLGSGQNPDLLLDIYNTPS